MVMRRRTCLTSLTTRCRARAMKNFFAWQLNGTRTTMRIFSSREPMLRFTCLFATSVSTFEQPTYCERRPVADISRRIVAAPCWYISALHWGDVSKPAIDLFPELAGQIIWSFRANQSSMTCLLLLWLWSQQDWWHTSNNFVDFSLLHQSAIQDVGLASAPKLSTLSSIYDANLSKEKSMALK